MSKNDMSLSDVQELTYKVEYLVQKLEQIQEDAPHIDRVATRIEKATERFDHTIKHAMHQIEDAIFNLDYTKLKEGLYLAVRTHTFELNDAVNRMKGHNKSLFNQLQQNNASISKNDELLQTVEKKIAQLREDIKAIPLLNRRLGIAVSALSFVAGMVMLYALSLIAWLPQPYYATAQQAQLLQMVQDGTLQLVPDALDTFKVTITTPNTTTGEHQ